MKITDSKYVSVLKYAYEKHKGQVRMNGNPFIIHPFKVSRILIEKGFDDICILAGVLHDVREDCKVPFIEILEFLMTVLPRKDAFQVLNIVWLLTKVKGSTPEQTIKRILSCKNPEIRNRALAVKPADILSNTRETIIQKNTKSALEFKLKWIEKANKYLKTMEPAWNMELVNGIKGTVYQRDIKDAMDRLKKSSSRRELGEVAVQVAENYIPRDSARGIA